MYVPVWALIILVALSATCLVYIYETHNKKEIELLIAGWFIHAVPTGIAAYSYNYIDNFIGIKGIFGFLITLTIEIIIFMIALGATIFVGSRIIYREDK